MSLLYFKVIVNACAQSIFNTFSLAQSAPTAPTIRGRAFFSGGMFWQLFYQKQSLDKGLSPFSSTNSPSLKNDSTKLSVRQDILSAGSANVGSLKPQYTSHSYQFFRTRKMFGQTEDDTDDIVGNKNVMSAPMLTRLFAWSSKYFA